MYRLNAPIGGLKITIIRKDNKEMFSLSDFAVDEKKKKEMVSSHFYFSLISFLFKAVYDGKSILIRLILQSCHHL